MKTILLTGLVLLSFSAFTQSNLIATSNGIGDIKLEMTKADVEAVIGQSLKLRPLSEQGWTDDTTTFVYNNVSYEIILQREANEKKKLVRSLVYQITCASKFLKTKSGITIGDDKLKIITTYEGYYIRIEPAYEDAFKQIKSKNRSVVMVLTDVNKAVIFYLTDNKVKAISTGFIEGC